MTPVTFSPVTMRPREYVTYNGYVPYNSSFDLSGAAIAGIVIGSLIVFYLLLWCCVKLCSSSRSTTTGETYVKAAPVVQSGGPIIYPDGVYPSAPFLV